MFNLVVLSGRLTSDPELKSTNSGLSVCNFTVANDVGYGDNKKTNFVKIVAWRGTAEFICKHFNKGNMIGIEGQLQVRKYQDNDGKDQYSTEVVASNIQFMEKKQDQSQQQNQHQSQPSDAFNNFVDQNKDIANFIDSDFIPIPDDDDCPF